MNPYRKESLSWELGGFCHSVRKHSSRQQRDREVATAYRKILDCLEREHDPG